MKKYLITLCMLSAGSLLRAQFAYEWANRIGSTEGYDVGNAITVDQLGNTYVVGRFKDTVDVDPSPAIVNLISTGDHGMFLVKYDTDGNYVWAKSMVGTGYIDGVDIARDVNGNIFITGWFVLTVDFDPSVNIANLTSSGNGDAFIAAYTPSGDYVWAKQIGAGADNEYGENILVDTDGSVYVTGTFMGAADFDPSPGTAFLFSYSYPPFDCDFFMAKYDANGNYVWAKHLGRPGASTLSYETIFDPNGNLCMTGYFIGTVDFDPSSGIANLNDGGFFIAKYDTSGNYIWAKSSFVYSKYIKFGSSGNIYGLAGYDIISKYDSSGNNLWYRVIVNVEGAGIDLDVNENIYITGTFLGTVDFDPYLGVAWLNAGGNRHIYLAKYDASGNYIWAKNIGRGAGNSTFNASYDIECDINQNIYITGYFQDTIDFDLSPDTASLSASGWWPDVFVAKYSECILNTFVTQNVNTLTATATGISYQWIDCNTEDLIPGETNQSFTAIANGNYAVIVTQGACSDTSECVSIISLGADDPVLPHAIIDVFPNPATEKITVTSNEKLMHATMCIVNIAGQTIIENINLNGDIFNVDISGLAEGVYIIEIMNSGNISRTKFVKK